MSLLEGLGEVVLLIRGGRVETERKTVLGGKIGVDERIESSLVIKFTREVKFIKLVVDLKNEISVERRDGKEEGGGVNRIIDDLLIEFYLREKRLKLENELGGGFAVRDGDREKVFLVGVGR